MSWTISLSDSPEPYSVDQGMLFKQMTNIGKTTLPALAAGYWQKLPHEIKDLNLSIFPRKAKQYLLWKQM